MDEFTNFFQEASMALSTCRECRKEVSSEAAMCPHCGVKAPVKKGMGLGMKLLLGFVGLVVIANLASGGSDTVVPTAGTTVAPLAAPAKPDSAAIAKRAADSTAAIQRFAALKSQMKFVADEVKGGGWWSVRALGNHSRKHLGVHVAADGRTYMTSDFTGDDWVFHDHIVVRVGDKVLTSETIPSYSDQNVTENSGGTVWETLHLTAGRDNGILDAIANSTTEKIIVRFEGSEHYADFTMSEADRKAMKAGVEFGALLRNWPHLAAGK